MHAQRKDHRQRVQRYAEEIRRHPEWAAMDFFSRFEPIRRLMRLKRTKANPQYPLQKSVLKGVAISEANSALKRDGYVSGLQLPQDAIEELIEFSQTQLCYGNKQLDQGFLFEDLKRAQKKTQSEFSIAIYHRVEEKLQLIQRLAHDPLIMQIAANYFCTTPVYTGCCLWWTIPAGNNFDSTL